MKSFGEIVKEINEIRNQKEYCVYGLRIDNYDYNVGDICFNSHNWWQDDLYGDCPFDDEVGMYDGGELNGTCAYLLLDEWQGGNLERELTECMENYLGEHVYLIAGDRSEYGNDDNEVIIEWARVLYKIQ